MCCLYILRNTLHLPRLSKSQNDYQYRRSADFHLHRDASAMLQCYNTQVGLKVLRIALVKLLPVSLVVEKAGSKTS